MYDGKATIDLTNVSDRVRSYLNEFMREYKTFIEDKQKEITQNTNTNKFESVSDRNRRAMGIGN